MNRVTQLLRERGFAVAVCAAIYAAWVTGYVEHRWDAALAAIVAAMSAYLNRSPLSGR